jgi:ABC-type sugar transport system ATPase subunit
MRLNGQIYSPTSPAAATAAGIGIVYQERSLMPNISVAENICLATDGLGTGPLVDRNRMRQRASELLGLLNSDVAVDAIVGKLSVARQQVVEIAKALARSPKILILDEPTSSIGAEAAHSLFSRLRRLRDDGLAIVYISHHLDEVFQIADRVTVLRDGEGRGTLPARGLDEDRLVSLMVGRDYSHSRERRDTTSSHGTVVLRVEGLTRRRQFQNIDLEVRQGEIVALTGLVGAGRTELAECIFGLHGYDAGRVLVEGRPLLGGRPDIAIQRGLCMLTEDRKFGLFQAMSVKANIVAPSIRHFGSPIRFDDAKARSIAKAYVDELSIRTESVEAPVSTLSGGNQQKVLFAMWLATNPSVLIVDEPTKGIDVAAKDEVHSFLLRLAEKNTGILLISSDQPEVRRLADRILVMRRGRLVAELSGEVAEETIVAYASGARS